LNGTLSARSRQAGFSASPFLRSPNSVRTRAVDADLFVNRSLVPGQRHDPAERRQPFDQPEHVVAEARCAAAGMPSRGGGEQCLKLVHASPIVVSGSRRRGRNGSSAREDYGRQASDLQVKVGILE
jgi:hypothetical protein